MYGEGGYELLDAFGRWKEVICLIKVFRYGFQNFKCKILVFSIVEFKKITISACKYMDK